MKRLFAIVAIIHTLLLLLVYWSDISNPGEDWSWMAAFLLDFPISIGIHAILHTIEQHLVTINGSLGLLLMHTVVGGIWWYSIVLVVRTIFRKK